MVCCGAHIVRDGFVVFFGFSAVSAILRKKQGATKPLDGRWRTGTIHRPPFPQITAPARARRQIRTTRGKFAAHPQRGGTSQKKNKLKTKKRAGAKVRRTRFGLAAEAERGRGRRVAGGLARGRGQPAGGSRAGWRRGEVFFPVCPNFFLDYQKEKSDIPEKKVLPKEQIFLKSELRPQPDYWPCSLPCF